MGYSSNQSDKVNSFSFICKLVCIIPVAVFLVSCSTYSPDPLSKSQNLATSGAYLRAVSWSELPGWQDDDLQEVWPAWEKSCQGLSRRNSSNIDWKPVCAQLRGVNSKSASSIRRYFESTMQVYEISHTSGSQAGSAYGLVTGYYEPYINGSRIRTGPYQTPLHRYPIAWTKHRPAPLPTREQLLASNVLYGQELVWVDDPVAAAFMQIQGSGRVRLPDGTFMRLGFAGTNDHPFKSFGSWLLERREITKAQATMQGISEWARKNPGRVQEMLNVNPRYVFFKELPNLADDSGPVGALGVSLTPGRSIAVDTKILPLGSPVYLATTYPLSEKPLRRLVVAQDTGTAIVGAVRADYYWGTGEQAAEMAGRMKQQGRMWLLLPK